MAQTVTFRLMRIRYYIIITGSSLYDRETIFWLSLLGSQPLSLPAIPMYY